MSVEFPHRMYEKKKKDQLNEHTCYLVGAATRFSPLQLQLRYHFSFEKILYLFVEMKTFRFENGGMRNLQSQREAFSNSRPKKTSRTTPFPVFVNWIGQNKLYIN